MKHSGEPRGMPIALALICAAVGGVLFIEMVAFPQPRPRTLAWFASLAEITFFAAVMGCGIAGLFAKFAKKKDLDPPDCEMIGYVMTVIGMFGSLQSHTLWGFALTLVGLPVGKLCRKLATTTASKDLAENMQAPN